MRQLRNISLVIMLALLPFFSNAQLLEVEQSVFGMDCAPCAYGVEKGLKNIEGIQTVKVSLNQGKAYITLQPDNQVSLSEIQQKVKSNGFSSRDAEVILQGELSKQEDKIFIETGQERYLILDSSDKGALAKIREMKAGSSVKVAGEVKAKESTQGHSWNLTVQEAG